MDINGYMAGVHKANRGWWFDIWTGGRLNRNKGGVLCLIHSEISECLEGTRTGAADKHLPHRSAEGVGLAGALIRVFDYAAGYGLDLQGAYGEGVAYNAQRGDHKVGDRKKPGGKKF